MLTILADENIPLVRPLFDRLGNVITMPGRAIQSRHLAAADVLLVRSVTRVSRDLLQGSAVQFVGSCTMGKDHLDIDYLEQSGISWANAPGCNADAVVQYVFSAMATLQPHWAESVIGIIGCGNIGGRLLHCLRRMGVKCVCYDPLISRDEPELTTLAEVLSADIISCHTPLTTINPFPTRHLLGARELSQLRSGALLINTSRGEVIDGNALLGLLLQRHKPFKVALDVWEGEPDIDLELLACVDIGTPHIAGHSLEGKRQGSVHVYRALCRYLGVRHAANRGIAMLMNSPKTVLQPDKKDDTQAQRNALLLAAYSIDNDDRQLRHRCKQQQPIADGFDQLRKNYPVRHDYCHCVPPQWLAKKTHRRFLEALGFADSSTNGLST